MAIPSVDLRPALWSGTSNPIVYKFSSSNFNKPNHRLRINLRVNGIFASQLDYYADPISGRITADISAMLRDELPVSAENDFTLPGDRIYQDANSAQYYIEFQEVWTNSAEPVTSDVANLRFAIRGGFQIGQANDYAEYVAIPGRKFLTRTNKGVKGLPFLVSFILNDISHSLKIEKYIGNTLDSVAVLPAPNGNRVFRGKINEDSEVDKVDFTLVARSLSGSSVSTLPFVQIFMAAGFGGGLFVAAGLGGIDANNIITSTDGQTWVQRTAPSLRQWTGYAFGNGIHVLVAQDGTAAQQVARSTDGGVTWIAQTASANNQWVDVTFGAGKFVAIANSGVGNRIMTSTDGQTWVTRTNPEDNNWISVTYSEDFSKFIAVSTDGTKRAMTSVDGETWVALAMPAGQWSGITSGNGLLVAVSNDSPGKIATSSNGVTWVLRTNPSAGALFSVSYGDGIFVSATISGSYTGVDPDAPTDRTIFSIDGITWFNKSLTAPGLRRVIFAKGLNKHMIFTNVSSSTAYIFPHSAVVLSEQLSVTLQEPCNSKMLCWKNKLGGDACFPFDFRHVINWNYGSGKKAERLQLFAEQLTLEQWEEVQDANTIGESYGVVVPELLPTVIRTRARPDQDARLLEADGSQKGVVVIPQSVSSRTDAIKRNANLIIELPELFML